MSTGGKGVHLSYEEYRAELGAMKAAREASMEGDSQLTANQTQPIDDLSPVTNTATSDQVSRSYWLFILAGLGALGLGWWLARISRRTGID